MRLGLYGGTFDPLHIAHMIIAQGAVDELGLEKLIFMPSRIPPHKTQNHITSAEIRLEMVSAATADNPRFVTSDYEIRQQGISYTVNTLQFLADEYRLAKTELFLVIGGDNYKDFNKWREPERIKSLCTLVVAARPNIISQQENVNAFHFLNTPLIDLSATDIRERVKTGKSIRYLVPEPVLELIRQYQLYT